MEEEKLDAARRRARVREDVARKELIIAAHKVAFEMESLIGGFAADPAYSVSELGVMQSKGQTVDRLCAVLWERRNHRKTLEDIV